MDFLDAGPGVAPNYNIEVVNTIPDFDALLFVDHVFADTVKACARLQITMAGGARDLEFVPQAEWSAFRARQNIEKDMLVNIRYSYIDPPPE